MWKGSWLPVAHDNWITTTSTIRVITLNHKPGEGSSGCPVGEEAWSPFPTMPCWLRGGEEGGREQDRRCLWDCFAKKKTGNRKWNPEELLQYLILIWKRNAIYNLQREARHGYTSACSASTWKAEAGGQWPQGSPQLHSKTISQTNKHTYKI